MKKIKEENIWDGYESINIENIDLKDIESIIEIDYSPLTFDEYTFLEKELKQITSYMPNHLMTKFWNFKNKIEGNNETQPCSCKSSGHHWKKCIDVLKGYIKKFN